MMHSMRKAFARATVLVMLALLAAPTLAWAEEPPPVAAPAAASTPAAAVASPADTAFMMVAAALVMLMTPGLGLFYGGMVRRKNVLATFQQSFIMLGVVALQWMLFGYSLAFGPDAFGGLIGEPARSSASTTSAWNRTPTTPRRSRTSCSWCTSSCSR